MNEYQMMIGLEVHVEVKTASKIFCGCRNVFGAEPNTHICPLCTGMPGTLPVLNRKVVERAVSAGIALNCKIAEYSEFDRKNYFYPDNPQNYQITQRFYPICQNGYLEIETEKGTKKIGIIQIHMEEDAGKLIHEKGRTLIDYNRSGVPLLEIVSSPDMENEKEVLAYLEKLRSVLLYLGISDCKMQEGSLRVDVNLSVCQKGSGQTGTRTEMKNLNSFRAVSHAVIQEAARQTAVLEAGETVLQETRRWDEEKNCSYSMRGKEEVSDYRYFQDPDLPPVRVDREWMDQIRNRQPELRDDKIKRFEREYKIPAYDIAVLTESPDIATLFENTTAQGVPPKKVSNWLMGETLRLMREHRRETPGIDAKALAELIRMNEQGRITGSVAREVFEEVFFRGVDPLSYVEEHNLWTVQDDGELEDLVKVVIQSNPESVRDYQNGKEKAIGFLVGQAMKNSQGRRDPVQVKNMLEKLLTNL